MNGNGYDRSVGDVLWTLLLVFSCAVTLLVGAEVDAQILKSQVVLTLTQLSQEKQKRVEGLQETIREYLDNSRWLDNPYDFDISFTLTMVLEDMSTSYEDRYSAQLQVSNNLDIQYADKYCFFPYQMNDPLLRDDNNYEPLTGLIDFYVSMILGGEMDKRAILGGTSFYQKAVSVCQSAGFGRSEYYKGWDSRKELVERMLADDMETFRKLQAIFFRAKVYHKDGDSEKARRYCRAVIVELGKMFESNPEDERIKDFFKYHYFEIGELFQEKKDPSLFKKLVELDPDHSEEYEKYID